MKELAHFGRGLESVIERMRADAELSPLTARQPFHRVPSTAEPVAFLAIKQAREAAASLPGSGGRSLRIGVRNDDGALAAICQLVGHEQSMRFATLMEALGYGGAVERDRVGIESYDIVFSPRRAEPEPEPEPEPE